MEGRNDDGTFAEGNCANRHGPQEGISHHIRRKYLKKWEEVFDSDPEILKEIKDKNKPEFIRLGLAAFPREEKIDLTDNRKSMTDDEFRKQVKQLNQMISNNSKGD